MSDLTTNEPTKQCCRCGRKLPGTREYFYADKRATDGLYGHCKDCHNEQGRKRYTGDQREKVLASQRQYRREFPDVRKETLRRYAEKNRESILSKRRDYDNSDKGKAAKKRWIAANPEKRKEIANRYARKNDTKEKRYRNEKRRKEKDPVKFKEQKSASDLRRKEKRNINWQSREARKRSLPTDFTIQDWQFALDYFGGCCAVCGKPLFGLFHRPAMDHWIPVSDPNCPGNIPTNIAPLCDGNDGCNQSKNAHDPEQWLQKKFPKQAKAILARIHEFFSKVRQV